MASEVSKLSIGKLKSVRFTILYEVDIEDMATISECLDKLREYGEAEIVDVEILNK